jgi:hypothetical protein
MDGLVCPGLRNNCGMGGYQRINHLTTEPNHASFLPERGIHRLRRGGDRGRLLRHGVKSEIGRI